MLTTILLAVGWYISGITLSLSNKILYSSPISFPIFSSFIQYLVQVLLSILILLFACYKPKISWSDYQTKVIPCGILTGLDIALSSSGLRLITLSFYTMIKSLGLFFLIRTRIYPYIFCIFWV